MNNKDFTEVFIEKLIRTKPEIEIKQSLVDLLNDWREKINSENNL